MMVDATAIWSEETAAVSVGKTLNGYYNFQHSEVKAALENSIDRLANRFPDVFRQTGGGEEEKTFLEETAPTAMFYCTNYEVWVDRLRNRNTATTATAQNPPNNSDPVPTDNNQPRSIKKEEGESSAEGLNSQGKSADEGKASGSNVQDHQTGEESGRSSKRVKLGSTAETSIKLEDDDEVDLSLGEDGKSFSSGVFSQGHANTGSFPSTISPAPSSFWSEHPTFIEIYSAREKSKILRLELKHVEVAAGGEHKLGGGSRVINLEKLEEQVKSWPYTKWPEPLVFIYVSVKDGSNTRIFTQQILETVYGEWRRNECGHIGDTLGGNDSGGDGSFRLFVNDFEGEPPRICDIGTDSDGLFAETSEMEGI